MVDIQGTIAPHVEAGWTEAMLLELRLQGVSGERIGAALAEVEAHVVDSGQSAEGAFGDPVDYARSLGLPAEPEQSRAATLKGVVPTLIQLFGLVAVVSAVPWGPDAVGVTMTQLSGLLATALLAVVVVAFVDRVLRAVVEHPIWVFLVIMLGLGAVAAGLVAAGRLGLDQTLFEVPRPVMLGVGLVALALGTWAAIRSTATEPDLVSSPVPGSGLLRPGVPHWVWTALPIPVATVVLAALLSLI
ncbi:MAG: hypothetical protein QM695_04055 [Micropruina sp.]